MNDVDAAGLGDFVTKPFGSISRPEPKAHPLQPPFLPYIHARGTTLRRLRNYGMILVLSTKISLIARPKAKLA